MPKWNEHTKPRFEIHRTKRGAYEIVRVHGDERHRLFMEFPVRELEELSEALLNFFREEADNDLRTVAEMRQDQEG